MPTFSTAFEPPAPLEGLTATAVGGAYVEVSWSPSELSAEDFVAYMVERSVDGGATWLTLATIADQATTLYQDYSAPLDRPLVYRVSQSNLDYASAPVEVTTALEGCAWWLVTPGALEASFEIPNVVAYESEWPLQSLEHQPIGRPLKLIETGLLLGEEGNLSAHLTAEHDPEVLNLLRAISAGASSAPLLKTPFGEVFAVVVGSIRRTRLVGGAQSVSFRFVSV